MKQRLRDLAALVVAFVLVAGPFLLGEWQW